MVVIGKRKRENLHKQTFRDLENLNADKRADRLQNSFDMFSRFAFLFMPLSFSLQLLSLKNTNSRSRISYDGIRIFYTLYLDNIQLSLTTSDSGQK